LNFDVNPCARLWQRATILAVVKIFLSLSVILLGSMFLGAPAPFTIRVVDERTGVGVPGLRVTTDNGIVCYTRPNGEVLWEESSLMDRGVRFEIRDEKNQFDGFGATLRVMYGGQAALKVHRQN